MKRANCRARSTRKAGALGILGLGCPEEYGGTPASLAMRSIAIQEIAKVGSGGLFVCLFTHSIFVQPMLALGTEEQKQRSLWMPASLMMNSCS
jgi:acyl-CoA dehydrogenase